MTRQEHLEWAKQRALAYLTERPLDAITSMVSDMLKHAELKEYTGLHDDAPYGRRRDVEFIREWIEAFK